MILPLCAPLLITSVRRTEQTAVAAEVRGFRLRTRASGYKRYPFTALDAAAFLFSALLLAGSILLG
jgi:energy-coupling factor transport system permease protein